MEESDHHAAAGSSSNNEPIASKSVINPEELPASSSTNQASDLPKPVSQEKTTAKEVLQIHKKVDIWEPPSGPRWHDVRGKIVTPRLLTKNIPEAFSYLPIFGKPAPNESLEDYHNRKIREFVGCDLDDAQWEALRKTCSPEHLKTGKELVLSSAVPTLGLPPEDTEATAKYAAQNAGVELNILRKHNRQMGEKERRNYVRRLKYRGVRVIPLGQQQSEAPAASTSSEESLEPGKDVLFYLRIFRPFIYNMSQRYATTALAPCRHSVLSHDVVLPGRAPLWVLRDRLICPNDVDARHDVSQNPFQEYAPAKDLFPSGFLFINNAFYVDDRPGCHDTSAQVREWARARGLGDFPLRPMSDRLEDIPLRMGHPDVYMHQGNCEHLFTISDVRLVVAGDPLSMCSYPCHTAISQNQSVYCTTCAEFSAKWIVTDTKRVPFDPAFFCDTCLKQYLYVDGKKVEDFKLYSYKGNEVNLLRPQV